MSQQFRADCPAAAVRPTGKAGEAADCRVSDLFPDVVSGAAVRTAAARRRRRRFCSSSFKAGKPFPLTFPVRVLRPRARRRRCCLTQKLAEPPSVLRNSCTGGRASRRARDPSRFRRVSSCELWYAFKEGAARILTLLLPNGHGQQQRAIEKSNDFHDYKLLIKI